MSEGPLSDQLSRRSLKLVSIALADARDGFRVQSVFPVRVLPQRIGRPDVRGQADRFRTIPRVPKRTFSS